MMTWTKIGMNVAAGCECVHFRGFDSEPNETLLKLEVPPLDPVLK